MNVLTAVHIANLWNASVGVYGHLLRIPLNLIQAKDETVVEKILRHCQPIETVRTRPTTKRKRIIAPQVGSLLILVKANLKHHNSGLAPPLSGIDDSGAVMLQKKEEKKVGSD